jgi:hypothetical protein
MLMKQATTLLFSNGFKYSPGSLYYKTFTVVIIVVQYCKLVLLSLLVSSNLVCYLIEALLLVSISPTFYEQLLRQNPFAKKLQTQLVSTNKVCKELWYEKAAGKILVKLIVIPKFFAQFLSAYNLGL